MPRVADYVMERLQEAGVGNIFLVTGRGALFLTDALAKIKTINPVCMHHEQSAAFAAVAQAQHSGKLGACLVSTGCASTNAITGVLSAWQDGLPCIVISGQNTLSETTRHTGIPLRTYGQQEADIIAVVGPITKYAVMITDPAQIAAEVDKALHLATTGRPGPVWIDIPLDIQSMQVLPEQLQRFVPEALPPGTPSSDDLRYAGEALAGARRPVLLVGSGIRAAEAIDLLRDFVARSGIPLTYAASAPDVFDGRHSLCVGSVGSMGCSRAGNFAVQNADLVLVIGCRLSSMLTGNDFAKFARAARIIVVDIDPVEHAKDGIRIDRLIVADAGKFLAALLPGVTVSGAQSWRDKCRHWKALFPRCEPRHRGTERVDLYHLAECLSRHLPENASLITDSGFAEIVMPTNVEFAVGQRCIHPVSQGAMGFALPAIVGVHFSTAGPIVAVVGDGSVMMNLQELQTIRHHGIAAKILIISNNAYAIIRRRQNDLFRSRTIGTDPGNGVSCPDFSEVAGAFGLPYTRIETPDDLEQRLGEILRTEGPLICEILGLERQEYIEMAVARNAAGRLVRRPLEDQSPFIDRETFLSEMIVEPIDL